MTIQEQLELQQKVTAHQATLGCAELKRRRLVREASNLCGRLTERAAKFSKVDQIQFDRSVKTLDRASRREERRERAYYGA